MGFDELISALQKQRRIQDHPEWEQFIQRKFPRMVSFYYTNQEGQEAYWDHVRVIKLDVKHLHLIVQGTHGDPLKFEIARMMHCKDADTGAKVQDLFFDLVRLWKETYEAEE